MSSNSCLLTDTLDMLVELVCFCVEITRSLQQTSNVIILPWATAQASSTSNSHSSASYILKLSFGLFAKRMHM